MLQRDYIMRLIEQLSGVIARLVFAKQAKNFDEALQIARTAYDELFGLSGEMVHELDAATLAQLVNDKEKTRALAKLLLEEGEVLVAKGHAEAGRARFKKSLLLYEAVVKKLGKSGDEDCEEAIEFLQERLAKT
ncbi:MAG: DUF6483 family protein [bacterium]